MRHTRKRVDGGYIYRGYFIRRGDFGQWWIEVDGEPVTDTAYFDRLKDAALIVDHWKGGDQ